MNVPNNLEDEDGMFESSNMLLDSINENEQLADISDYDRLGSMD
jgi:hypothetical protein